MATVIQMQPDQYLRKVDREKRTRGQIAWMVHDIRTNTLLLTQKLGRAVEFINQSLASVNRERVSQVGLWEAADTMGNRVDGCHKFRYRISKCKLETAHDIFNKKRNELGASAIILTAAPNTYKVDYTTRDTPPPPPPTTTTTTPLW